MMELAFVLAGICVLIGLFNLLWFIPATFFLILGLALYFARQFRQPSTPSAPTPTRPPLTEWNPAHAARRGESKAERHKRVEELAQDKDAAWGRWSQER